MKKNVTKFEKIIFKAASTIKNNFISLKNKLLSNRNVFDEFSGAKNIFYYGNHPIAIFKLRRKQLNIIIEFKNGHKFKTIVNTLENFNNSLVLIDSLIEDYNLEKNSVFKPLELSELLPNYLILNQLELEKQEKKLEKMHKKENILTKLKAKMANKIENQTNADENDDAADNSVNENAEEEIDASSDSDISINENDDTSMENNEESEIAQQNEEDTKET